MHKLKHTGFTLVEILIVVAIVTIIFSIAIPSYQSQMQKTRRADGQAKLLEVLNAQERYYTVNNTYATNLSVLSTNYTNSTEPSENGFYTISAAACGGTTIANCVQLTATAEAAQSDDGNLTLNSLGVKAPAEKW